MSNKNAQIRLVIFDWAGTTVDFGSRAPATAFHKVFAAHGVEVSDAEARKPMGLNKREHLVAMLSEPDLATRWHDIKGQSWTEADVDVMYEQFVPLQLSAIEETTSLVPGLLDVIDQLRSQNILIGGTTGYFLLAAETVANAAAAQGFIPDANMCADDVQQGRPAPWMIYQIMSKLGVYPAASVVKVGDTIADVQAGLNAGCWTVGVCDSSSMTGLALEDYQSLSGNQRSKCLKETESAFRSAGAHAVIESISELPSVLERFGAAFDRV